MRTMKRVYIYREDFDKIVEWGKNKRKINKYFREPNLRANFPFYLEQYLMEGGKTDGREERVIEEPDHQLSVLQGQN